MSATLEPSGGLSVGDWPTLARHARKEWGFKEAVFRLAGLMGLTERTAKAALWGEKQPSTLAAALAPLTDQLIAAAERDLAELRAIRERQHGETVQGAALPARGVARRGVGATRRAVAPVAVKP